MSCAFLCSLWMVYLTFSILQTKKVEPFASIKVGSMCDQDLPRAIKYWMVQCDKKFDYTADYKICDAAQV